IQAEERIADQLELNAGTGAADVFQQWRDLLQPLECARRADPDKLQPGTPILPRGRIQGRINAGRDDVNGRRPLSASLGGEESVACDDGVGAAANGGEAA